MEWRYTLLRYFGPGLMGGLTFRQWVQLLRTHRFAVATSCLPRAMAISWQSIQNSVLERRDQRRLGAALKEVVVAPPLFLLGHWRHGTTHLHNLLTVDDRFAFPNNYQAMFPETFLAAESLHSRAVEFFLPKRRPMDNVEWTMQSPQEDEFALCISTFMSPYMGWIFPRERDFYDRYLTFRGVDAREIAEWQEALLRFLKKVTWKTKRPLVLKSPPHTCRIKLLLQLFPEAKFIHLRRNPYAVFLSSRRTFQVNFDLHRLQRLPGSDLDDWIFSQYRRMYEAFFEERPGIPAGRFHEVSYEELEQDPIGQVRRIYDALRLPDFTHAEPALRKYVASIAGYRKNEFPPLSATLRQRIGSEWRFTFEQWGYPV